MPLSAEDRLAIIARTASYCHALDLGDGDAYAANFTEDGVLEGPFDNLREGREEISAMLAGRPRQPRPQSRQLTYNSVVDGDGDRATSVCYATAMRVEAAETIWVGRYQDQLQKVDGTWLFERRKIDTDWLDGATAKGLAAEADS